MKEYKNYAELRSDILDFYHKNPLRSSLLIDGEEVGVYCNFLFTVVLPDGEIKEGTASLAMGMTAEKIVEFHAKQVDKITDNVMQHLKTIK
jgi:hypothetical protein